MLIKPQRIVIPVVGCEFTKWTCVRCRAERKQEDVWVQQNGTQGNWLRKI